MTQHPPGPVKGLLIHPGRNYEIIELLPTLDPMREAIGGGYLERVTAGDTAFYLDEEGKYKGLEPNPAATVLSYRLGWRAVRGGVFVGTVLVLGPLEHGWDTSVTDDTLAVWKELMDALPSADTPAGNATDSQQ